MLQKLSGSGDAIIKAGGSIIRRTLKEGESLRVAPGCLVAFAPTIDYDVQMVKGFKNAIFGGEGLFLTTLRGPGEVILQSLSFDRLVGQIAKRIASRESARRGGGNPDSSTGTGMKEGRSIYILRESVFLISWPQVPEAGPRAEVYLVDKASQVEIMDLLNCTISFKPFPSRLVTFNY